MKTLEEVLQDWEAVIGLEIHAELTTLNTKMFCGCKLEFGAEPNTHTCPVCLGLPGALPVPNKAAIESIVLAGLATNCDIEKHSMFYRKNYMYPDMSKNFQTTQGPIAFCMRGHLELDVDGPGAKERVDLDGLKPGEARGNVVRTEDGYIARVGITRIHMEEDAGRWSISAAGKAASPAPRTAWWTTTAPAPRRSSWSPSPSCARPKRRACSCRSCARSIPAIGISDCSMEEGSLRCDGNVSLRRRGETKFGTKTELKNMNSFKQPARRPGLRNPPSGAGARRGRNHLSGNPPLDPSAKRTIVMRVKETADDYRLCPEPDMAPFDLTEEFVENVRKRLPELPNQKAKRYEAAFGLSAYDARHLVEHRVTSAFFEAAMQVANDAKLAKPLANLVINDITARMNADDAFDLESSALSPERAVELVKLAASDAISSKQAKEVFAAVIDEDKDPSAIVEERGMKQVSDTGAIEAVVDAVIVPPTPTRWPAIAMARRSLWIFRRPVHEADARPGQSEDDQSGSGEKARLERRFAAISHGGRRRAEVRFAQGRARSSCGPSESLRRAGRPGLFVSAFLFPPAYRISAWQAAFDGAPPDGFTGFRGNFFAGYAAKSGCKGVRMRKSERVIPRRGRAASRNGRESAVQPAKTGPAVRVLRSVLRLAWFSSVRTQQGRPVGSALVAGKNERR